MNYKDNDYELLYLVSENNEDAYERLFAKYSYLISSTAKYYYNLYKNYNLSMDELEQEGRIALYDAIKDYKEKYNTKLITFIGACLKNRMNCYIKKMSAKKIRMLLSSLSLDNCNLASYSTYNEILNKELEQSLIIFKNDLDFIDANIFEMHYNYYSYKDIATLLEMNIKQIDNRLLKIRSKLKSYLRKNDLIF